MNLNSADLSCGAPALTRRTTSSLESFVGVTKEAEGRGGLRGQGVSDCYFVDSTGGCEIRLRKRVCVTMWNGQAEREGYEGRKKGDTFFCFHCESEMSERERAKVIGGERVATFF